MLSAHEVRLTALDGRILIENLSVRLGRESVAIVGRNGVGKTTLLRALAGETHPDAGVIRCGGDRHLVPQAMVGDASPGELRRQALVHAFARGPDVLLLDEPSNDLDPASKRWLLNALSRCKKGLIVVSHDDEVLDRFTDFFVVSESGCHHRSGLWSDVRAVMVREARRRDEVYARALTALDADRRAHDRVSRRRARKKAVGRLHELDRNQSKARLNKRKSAAQVSQAKVRARQDAVMEGRERWGRSLERALTVNLPLSTLVPDVDPGPRLGIMGPNGSGKSTSLRAQLRDDDGVIEQGAVNWMLEESTRQMVERFVPWDEVAQHLVAHRFPVELANRPMRTLSPGERTRAALVILFCGPIRRLVLDEPTWSLDAVGRVGLIRVLQAWKGGLYVVSHDPGFLASVGATLRSTGRRSVGGQGATIAQEVGSLG